MSALPSSFIVCSQQYACLRLWEFSCHDSELEPALESITGASTQLRSCPPVVYPPENIIDYEAEMMVESFSDRPCVNIQHIQGLANSYLPPGLFPTYMTPLPTFSTQMLSSDGTPQDERYTCQDTRESYARGKSQIHGITQNDSLSGVRSAQLYPSNPLSSPKDLPSSHTCPASNGSLSHHMTSQPNSQPRIPRSKPPEVETLLNSHLCFIPLLLWIPHDSGLVRYNLPPEYAYLCMGLFFISDLSVSYRYLTPTAIEKMLAVCSDPAWRVIHYRTRTRTGLLECHPSVGSGR